MRIAEVVMEGPVLIVDNQGIGHQNVPLNETTYFSWNAFYLGVVQELSCLHCFPKWFKKLKGAFPKRSTESKLLYNIFPI
jgi:hypothetical protein